MVRHLVRAGLLPIALLGGVVSACDGSSNGSLATPGATTEASTGAGGTQVPNRTVSADGHTGSPAIPLLHQAWATATLADVRTGAQVRIADIVASGRVVFLEPMAIWCTNCRAQQHAAVAAFERLDRERVEWIGLDIETAEDADQLARYSQQNGFDFTYVIADRDVSRALAEDFGDVVLNPPATNIIVIGTDGSVAHSTGHRSADELVQLATSHGGG